METSAGSANAVMTLEWHQLVLKYTHLRVSDAQKHARLLTSLAEGDQQTPVVVVASEPTRFVLIDGYARVAALRKLGRDVVLAVALTMSEAQALVFCHRTQTGSHPNALEEAWLLYELVQSHGLEQRHLAMLLSRSPSWVSRRLALLAALPDSAPSGSTANGSWPGSGPGGSGFGRWSGCIGRIGRGAQRSANAWSRSRCCF
jgi:ParB/RepB/Spo0J family partition protein